MSLAGSLVMTSFMAMPATTQQEYLYHPSESIQHIQKALYKEFELEKPLRRIEKLYLPEWTKEYGPYVFILYDVAQRKRISYTWTF